ncbi:T9SS C-terminal target domain-containing protein [Salibacteraceae bacterium]|nr:T9SS C-terminal target domain-containing protein [Salibacteraceae bacterium]MDB9708629.1 T9SS C-terminal target domain-containing protein [Salibacteraceae bacterium]MDC1304434.1 T9SS C-terminal target domain-containing protein [Salibacteraceae bacterium]
MKRLLSFFALLTVLTVSHAQTILITDPSFDQANPLDCPVINTIVGPNFYDDGGPGGNYSPNFSDTIVFCPDLVNNSKVVVAFSFGWSVGAGDSVYAWDGPDVFSPYLGAHNSFTDPSGFSAQASYFNNPSGCITVAFQSGPVVDSAGWDANVACASLPQPFVPHMQGYVNGNLTDSMVPADTGRITMCGQDSILYVATADFPFSLENAGIGYSQNDTNVIYKWFFSDGQTAVGDSVWYFPPNSAGYVVTLQVTDQFPYTEQIASSIRVAPRIDFSQTRALNDSICEGDTVILIAGLTGSDTVGVSSTVSITEVGGSFAGLTFLPDGNQVNYEAEVEISGFGSGQTLSSGVDVMRLSITMEHSFLGDLEMMLSCPNGDSIIVFNSFGGTGIGPAFAGGFNGGGTYLGDALDDGTSNPGIGWTYNFSDTLADWGTMATEHGLGNTLPTTLSPGQGMNPDSIYLPEQTFDDLIGCPVNGTWKLTIRDNLAVDNGYIFDWAIFFNPYINPNFESYTSTIVDAQWHDGNSVNDPAVTSFGDTIVSLFNDTAGFNYYTFQVLDDFGCLSDTTISVYQTPKPLPVSIDTGTCLDEITLSVSNSDSTFWNPLYGESHLQFSPSNQDTIVLITTDSNATYLIEMQYFKNQCLFLDTLKLSYYGDIPADLFNDTLGCFGDTFAIIPATDELNAVYSWSVGGETDRELVVTQSGTYYLTVTGCNSQTDSIDVTFYRAPRLLSQNPVCDSLDTISLSKSSLGGYWSILDSEIDTNLVFLQSAAQEAILFSDQRGFVTVGYFDSTCASLDSLPVQFGQAPSISINDSTICAKDRPFILTITQRHKDNYSFRWSNGSNDSSIAVYDTGYYSVIISNECGTDADEVFISFLDCQVHGPNVITPNGDGLNDYFDLGGYEYFDQIYLSVYNRWGVLIFKGSGNNARWDGHLPSGELVSPGVYFYNLVVDGRTENGSVSVLYE